MKMNRRNLFKTLAAVPVAASAQKPEPRARVVSSPIGGAYNKHDTFTFGIGPTETITMVFDHPGHPLYIRERK